MAFNSNNFYFFYFPFFARYDDEKKFEWCINLNISFKLLMRRKKFEGKGNKKCWDEIWERIHSHSGFVMQPQKFSIRVIKKK